MKNFNLLTEVLQNSLFSNQQKVIYCLIINFLLFKITIFTLYITIFKSQFSFYIFYPFITFQIYYLNILFRNGYSRLYQEACNLNQYMEVNLYFENVSATGKMRHARRDDFMNYLLSCDVSYLCFLIEIILFQGNNSAIN